MTAPHRKEVNRDRRRRRAAKAVRCVDHINLQHPFAPQTILSDDAVAAIHDAALAVLETDGIKILSREARALLRTDTAIVNDSDQMVYIGREIIAAALATAPRRIRLRAANPARERLYAPGALLFLPGAVCPNATDRINGRRPGCLADYEAAIRLAQHFDVIHALGPSVEPQDIANPLRHYALMRTQMVLADKPAFIYARGRAQIAESLKIIRLANQLDEAGFADGSWAFTVINTNSPRQIDVVMAEGIIDMARASQMSIITPFCLAGAMAPISIMGALVLQHAEALAGITLAQAARRGAPVSYGGFAANVDMKSGAPAFGTPAHVQLTLGTGQLARHIGLPWRSSVGVAANSADAQAAAETQISLWAALLANATAILHTAGWLEGGLSFGFEKFILDVEILQIIAELCTAVPEEAHELARDAIAAVPPGGHFFATAHTMARFATAFYAPLVSDGRNYGAWMEAGGSTATERATLLWQNILATSPRPPGALERADRIAGYIADRTAAGGAAPG